MLAQFGELNFPPPPRLAISAEELAERKTSDKFKSVRDSAIRKGDAILKKGVTVPDGPGDWIFYYANPDNGRTLKPLSLTEHQCPATDKIFTDERTIAAYRTMLHNNANRDAEQLAWAYAYSGEAKYALAVKGALLKLAEDYETYPSRRDRWGRTSFLARLGGRRYSQSLSEAVGVIKLAYAYDLTRISEVYSQRDHQLITEKFFRPTAKSLLWFNQGINNHQTWYNAGLLAIASVLADEQIVQRVLTMKGGVAYQLENSIGADGLWYEGAMAYHFYALAAMMDLADIARGVGLSLHDHPRFKAMFDAPLKAAYPNGIFPAINDSDWRSIRAYRSAYNWAADRYGDDRYRDPITHLDTNSIDLPDAGLAILRRGKGKTAACAMIDYGPHGGGHGHYDKLQLVLFAGGREWLLDPGRLNYRHKEYKTWVKHTAAHNTVAIGQRSQNASTAKLLWFDAADEYAACGTESVAAYPRTNLKRYVLLMDQYAVDVFDVKAPQAEEIDWLMHVTGDLVEPALPFKEGEAVGSRNGYEHLVGATAIEPPADGPLRFVAKKDREGEAGQLRVWFAGDSREQLIGAFGIGHLIGDREPCIIRRVQAASVRFVAVYDFADQATVKAVSLSNTGEVLVTTSSGTSQIQFDASGVKFTTVESAVK